MPVSPNINVQNLSDEELISNIKAIGFQRVQSEIYERYAQLIYYKCISMLKNEHDAKDTTHDIIIKVFTKLESFKGRSKFSLWVHSISVNHVLSTLKKKKRLKLFENNSDDEVFENVAENEIELLDKIIIEIKIDALEKVMSSLPEGERLIMIMKYVQGLSIHEISQILNIGPSAVKMRLSRTRLKMESMVNQITSEHEQY